MAIMQKEQITDKQGIFLIISFIIGSTLIIGISGSAKNDAWIAAIVGFIMVLPMLLIYAKIILLYQGKDIFEIFNIVLGKVAGKIASVLYSVYAVHLGSLVLRNFGEFTNTIAIPETPIIVPMFCMGIVCIIATRLGTEVLGRTTTYFLPIIFFILLIVQLMVIPEMNLKLLKPFLGNGLIPVLKGGFSAFSFPYAETVIFLGISGSFKTTKSPYKVYFLGISFSLIILIFTTIRNIAVLGNMLESFYFPSYQAVGRIHIGEFIERIEVTVSTVFVFGVFIKSSMCLLVACKGLASVFGLKHYKSIAIQLGLLMVYLSFIIYDNIMQMKYWAFKVYPYYAFPVQVILPTVIWVLAEFKNKLQLNKQK